VRDAACILRRLVLVSDHLSAVLLVLSRSLIVCNERARGDRLVAIWISVEFRFAIIEFPRMREWLYIARQCRGCIHHRGKSRD